MATPTALVGDHSEADDVVGRGKLGDLIVGEALTLGKPGRQIRRNSHTRPILFQISAALRDASSVVAIRAGQDRV